MRKPTKSTRTPRKHQQILIDTLESRQMFSNTIPVVAQPWTDTIYFSNNSGNQHVIAADFQVTINWGDGSQTTTKNVQPDGPGPNPQNFFATAMHTYTQVGPPTGNNAVIFNYTGPGPASHRTWQGSMDVSVADAPMKPIPATISVAKGATYSGPVGSFSYNNPYAKASDFYVDVQASDTVTHQHLIGTVSGSSPSWTVSVQNAHLTDVHVPFNFNLQTAIDHKLLNGRFGSVVSIKSPVTTTTTNSELFAGNSNAANTVNQDSAQLQQIYNLYAKTAASDTAVLQFTGGLEIWAKKTFNQFAGLLKTVTSDGGILGIANNIVNSFSAFMYAGPDGLAKGSMAIASNAMATAAQEIKTNPAQFFGKVMPDALIAFLTMGGGTAAEAAAATTALADLQAVGEIATVLHGEASTAGMIDGIGGNAAIAETADALGARAVVTQGKGPALTIESAPIFVKGEEAVYRVGTTKVTLYGSATISKPGLQLIKGLLEGINDGAFAGEHYAAGTSPNFLNNCIDCATIVMGRLNEVVKSGKVPAMPKSALPAEAISKNELILTSRFGGQFDYFTTLKSITTNHLTTAGSRGIAVFKSGNTYHAIVVVNLGKDGLWFLDGQSQTAIAYNSVQWLQAYGKVPATSWSFLPVK